MQGVLEVAIVVEESGVPVVDREDLNPWGCNSYVYAVRNVEEEKGYSDVLRKAWSLPDDADARIQSIYVRMRPADAHKVLMEGKMRWVDKYGHPYYPSPFHPFDDRHWDQQRQHETWGRNVCLIFDYDPEVEMFVDNNGRMVFGEKRVMNMRNLWRVIKWDPNGDCKRETTVLVMDRALDKYRFSATVAGARVASRQGIVGDEEFGDDKTVIPARMTQYGVRYKEKELITRNMGDKPSQMLCVLKKYNRGYGEFSEAESNAWKHWRRQG